MAAAIQQSSTLAKQPLWSPRDVERTTTYRFMQYVSKRQALNFKTYHDLHAWSSDGSTVNTFWALAFEFLEIQPQAWATTSYTAVGRLLSQARASASHSRPVMNSLTNEGLMKAIQKSAALSMFPPPRFFPDAKINITELIIRATQKKSGPLIYFARDGDSEIEEVSSAEVRSRTRQIYDALIGCGINAGDRVAAVSGNSVNTIALCLATLAIGAVWSSTSCDSGPEAIIARFGQIEPKIIFADDGYVYAGKLIKLGNRIVKWSNAIGGCSRLRYVVIVPSWKVETDVSKVHGGMQWEEFLAKGSGRHLTPVPLAFDHPAFILFSSGTTGKPKCIVHSTGGIALKTQTDAQLQHDMRSSDVVFQFTTTAWVMWVLNFASLAVGASMLLYEGSPFHPRPEILLELAEKTGVTVFGTSPRYLMELRSRGIIPRRSFDLEKLRTLTSTGAVLNSDVYHWFYDTAFPRTTQLISMSGGTDIAGTFVGGTPLLPVYPGEIQAKSLGMAIDIFDSVYDKPRSIETTGEPGELVCTLPFPSQPIEFLGTDGLERYRKSYFERFGPKVWCQGDSAMVCNDTKGLVIIGRSDGVLNPSGVRFGPAEIYAVTETFTDEIEDALCVGQRRKDDEDEAVLLFLKLKEHLTELGSGLMARLTTAIKERYSPRHVPAYMFRVADIPYTSNGKKCEINVKQIVNGLETEIGSTVVNPDSFRLYTQYARLPRTTTSSNKRLNSKL